MQTVYIFAVLCFVGIFTESSGSNTQIIVEDLNKRNRQLEDDNAALQKQVDLIAENLALRSAKADLEKEVYRLRVANFELAEKNANLERENKSLFVELADFYTKETGFKIRFGAEKVPDCSDKCKLSDINNGVCDTSCNNSFCEWDGEDCHTFAKETNQDTMIKHYGPFFGSILYTSLAFNKAFGYVHRKVPAHAPYITDTATMNELQDRFPKEWAKTSANRFRDPHSFQHAFAFYHFLLRPRRDKCDGIRKYPIATTYQNYDDYTYAATGNLTRLEHALILLLHKKHKKYV